MGSTDPLRRGWQPAGSATVRVDGVMTGTTRRIEQRADLDADCHRAWEPARADDAAPPAPGETSTGPAETPTSLIIADDLPDGLVIAGADGRVEVFNAAAVRLTGVQAADALGQPVVKVLPLSDLDGRD